MSKLNESITIKNIKLSNRLVMPPMATAKSNEKGEISQALCDYYSTKSKEGYIGLIIVEHSYINQEGIANKGQISISKDSDIDGLKKLVASVHSNGSKVIAQINHAGGAAKKEITGCEILSASPIPLPRADGSDTVPKEMTQEDINKVISDFAQAARRAKEAGFDGVEIHSAHGYLLNQFYSPLNNKRTDPYSGSSIEGRIKIHLEVIKAVKEAVGPDYLVALRLGASDYREGGTTIEDSIQAAIAFEKAGIDLLDISGGFCGFTNPNLTEQGYFSELTEKVKKNINIPVMLTGGIVEGEVANKLLTEGKADLIGVGRAILKNDEWAKNAILNK